MKRKVIIALCLAIVCITVLCCFRSAHAVPTQEEVIAVLTEKGATEAEQLLMAYSCEDILAAWGEPDIQTSCFLTLGYKTENAITICVFFSTENGMVSDVAFYSQAKA